MDKAARDEAAHDIKVAVKSKHQIILNVAAPVMFVDLGLHGSWSLIAHIRAKLEEAR